MNRNKTRQVQILQRETIFERFIFRIDELELRHATFDGGMSAPMRRLVLERGEAAAVLLHDTAAGCVLLCEQFRAATLEHGTGWLLELPAGMLDEGETAEDCARRETLEETGQGAGPLTRIATVYPSPGGSSERIHVFYGSMALRCDLPGQGGLADEGEDIHVVLMPTGDAFAMLRRGELTDAKTVVALQWLEAHLQGRNAAR